MDLSTLEIEYSLDKRLSDNRVHVYMGMDLKDEYKKRVDNLSILGLRDYGWVSTLSMAYYY